jgi:DNA-binding HxlR family transcriptional regulator
MKPKPASKPAASPQRSDCPIAYALDFVGDRWTLVVLRDLIMLRKRRFTELQSGNEGIATNILASRLKRLEAAGMIRRQRDPDQARRVVYLPTAKALDLLPVLVELVRWGNKYYPKSSVPPRLLRRMNDDQAGFIAELRASHGHSAPRD